MKKIIRWQASDGGVFVSKAKCQAYERFNARVGKVLQILPPRPKGNDFFNGHGYLQLSPLMAVKVHTGLRKLQAKAILDDRCRNLALSVLAERLNCVDKQWREWGQPYWADHSDKAPEVKCLLDVEDPNYRRKQ